MYPRKTILSDHHCEIFYRFEFQNPTLYLSVPIVLNVVLLLSNVFAILGAVARSRVLLLPWLLLYTALAGLTVSLMVLVLVSLPLAWLRVNQTVVLQNQFFHHSISEFCQKVARSTSPVAFL